MTSQNDTQRQAAPGGFADLENRWFSAWEQAGCFSRSQGRGQQVAHPFTVVIPPPNITGVLHMGHALNDTIQDACVRRARMQGRPARWVLGTDHAGIATQTKVDKKLADEGVSRLAIGREAFIDECWKWRAQYGSTIVSQIKGMGCSCDYDDERFTLDEQYARAVRQVFADWYHDGLIYRGKRIVNWCPHCTTAIADDEAEYVEESGHLWHLRYPLAEPVDGRDYIVVATTRPETMLGDTGVAVSPSDEEKAALVGKSVVLPLVNRTIPIFSDWHVDAGFGTGFVKVTPAHDPNDWAMGERNGLERINVFDETAHVVEGYGRFSGMSRDEARQAIVEEFDRLGLLDKVEDHQHSVMTCYRCHTKLEPWESEQWFVAVEDLKARAAQVVEDGQIVFHPERWKTVYLDWLANLKDWCISRQLWWGHRIPMYYCDSCGYSDALVDHADVCPTCGEPLRQEEDVLDTWFSSQLWPFATMDWTERGASSPELQRAYPTQVLSTARDIMGLWVARMVMSSLYCTGQIPFQHVIIHPTVMGADGKPMSKSRGNGVDPLRLMEDYGADGMRFGLLMQVTGGQDLRFNEAKLESSRNFANKIRNAARFVGMHLDGFEPGAPEPITLADQWIMSRLARLVAQLDRLYEGFEFGEATRELYAFFWNEFCDWYIELSKSRLEPDADPADRLACQRNLMFVLDQAIRLLHPIMPFVTEEIYHDLPFDRSAFPLLIEAPWPDAQRLAGFVDSQAERAIELVCEAVSAVRSTRARYGISPREPLAVVVKASQDDCALLERQRSMISSMQNALSLELSPAAQKPAQAAAVLGSGIEVYIGLAGLVDFEAERARLQKERAKFEAEAQKLGRKLSNEGYLAKAAPQIIEKDRGRHADALDRIERIDAQLSEL
ncbi:valine--tRNA ligase [Eggerthellaceae bacterium zg-997]|nr:valine--tRNA ligase [Eggerthellaceae bacterium zg-997]